MTMKTRPTLAYLVIFGTLFHFTAQAQETPNVAVAPASAASSAVAVAPEVASSAASAKPAATARELPKLDMRWDCGSCEHNEKVLPLIEQEYAKEAAAKGYAISSTETAELRITEYRQRPPAMRVMFGLFAGKDILKTQVTFRGKEFVAEDYAANALEGMNSLCASVAKKALTQIGSNL